MNFSNDVAATMALEVKHRIAGFDVKSPYPQQLPSLATSPETPVAHGVPRSPASENTAHRGPWSSSLPPREAEGGVRFHDWFPTGHSAHGAHSVPGRTSPAPKSHSRIEGVKAFQAMCSASRSMAAVDSPTVLRQHRVEVVGTTHTAPGVRRLVRAVTQGLRACQEPEAAEAGLGGTYFFKNENGAKIAIVKPLDEEPLAPNNPKGFVGRELGDPGLKPTVRVGEAALREVAAFLLDHQGFAKVPATVLVRVTHPIFHVAPALAAPPSSGTAASGGPPDAEVTSAPNGTPAAPPAKLGSLQEFVTHECDTSEMGASRFAVADVHRIGILDIRLYNTDRHAGNMLVRRPRAGSVSSGGLARLAGARLELCPIDHGFCLPEALEPPYLEWLHWPQAMIPFDEEELAYIAALDPEADVELLRRELPNLRDSCLRTLEVSTTLLKMCAAAGLSLSEIGTVMSRPLVGIEEEPSELERLCLRVRQSIDAQHAWELLEGGHTADKLPGDSDWDSGNEGGSSSEEEEGDEPVTPVAAAQPMRFVGPEKQPALLLPLDEGGLCTARSSSGPLIEMLAGSCGGRNLCHSAGCKRTASANGKTPALGGLVPVSENSSVHGLSLLSDMLNPGADALSETADGGSSISGSALRCTSSGSGSAYGLLAQPSDGSETARAFLAAYGMGPVGQQQPAAAAQSGRPASQSGGRPGEDLLFDFDEGRNGGSNVHTPRATGVSQGPFQTPSPQRAGSSLSTPLKRVSLTSAQESTASPEGGTPLSYSRYAAASLPPITARDFGPRRRSQSAFTSSNPHNTLVGLADTPETPGSLGHRAMQRVLANADSLSSEDNLFGSRPSAPPEPPSMMAMSVAVPTPMGRGGARHHGMHRVRSRHHTGVKAMKPKALAYPPPIEGADPAAVNDVFKGLDQPQWAAFVTQLRGEIAEALAVGIWRAERTPGPQGAALGTSCPRF